MLETDWFNIILGHKLSMIGIFIGATSFLIGLYFSNKNKMLDNSKWAIFSLSFSLIITSFFIIFHSIATIQAHQLSTDISNQLQSLFGILLIPLIFMSILLGLKHPRS